MNARFSDYVTSGAFQMALTRNQIATLSLMVGGDKHIPSPGALQRKGLIEPVMGNFDGYGEIDSRIEWRLTAAGALALALLNEAGLTNSGADTVAHEIDDLHKQIEAARLESANTLFAALSLHAKLKQAEQTIAIREAQLNGEKIPIHITPQDPMPNKSADEVLREVQECRER